MCQTILKTISVRKKNIDLYIHHISIFTQFSASCFECPCDQNGAILRLYNLRDFCTLEGSILKVVFEEIHDQNIAKEDRCNFLDGDSGIKGYSY